MGEEPDLIGQDPNSKESLQPLVEVVTEELLARISVGDRLETVDDARSIAELIAAAVLDRFVVRPRVADPIGHRGQTSGGGTQRQEVGRERLKGARRFASGLDDAGAGCATGDRRRPFPEARKVLVRDELMAGARLERNVHPS